MTPKEQEFALAELEERVDRLRNLYEQYFLGFEKLEPAVPRKDVDRRFALLRKEQIRNTAMRFRFQVITQKFNTYATHWIRICRQIEDGTYKRHIRKAKAKFGDARGPTPDVSIDVDLFDFDDVSLDDLLAETGPTSAGHVAAAETPKVALPVQPDRTSRSASLPPGARPMIVRKRAEAQPASPVTADEKRSSSEGIEVKLPPSAPRLRPMSRAAGKPGNESDTSVASLGLQAVTPRIVRSETTPTTRTAHVDALDALDSLEMPAPRVSAPPKPTLGGRPASPGLPPTAQPRPPGVVPQPSQRSIDPRSVAKAAQPVKPAASPASVAKPGASPPSVAKPAAATQPSLAPTFRGAPSLPPTAQPRPDTPQRPVGPAAPARRPEVVPKSTPQGAASTSVATHAAAPRGELTPRATQPTEAGLQPTRGAPGGRPLAAPQGPSSPARPAQQGAMRPPPARAGAGRTDPSEPRVPAAPLPPTAQARPAPAAPRPAGAEGGIITAAAPPRPRLSIPLPSASQPKKP